jgi:hypothetical protein
MKSESTSPCSQQFATGRTLEPHKPSPLPYTQHLKDPLHHNPPATTIFPKQPIYEICFPIEHKNIPINSLSVDVSAHGAIIMRYSTASFFQVLRLKFCRPMHFSSSRTCYSSSPFHHTDLIPTSIDYEVLHYVIIFLYQFGSVVVKALCCKPEGRGFKSRRGVFF